MSGATKDATLAKLQPLELPALIARAELAAEPAAAAAQSTSASEAVAALEARGFLLDAVRLFAHALPKRESVWWACMCARHTSPQDLPAKDRAALEAAEVWVRRQTDETRRDAMAKAQASGMHTPEAWTAVSAFFSGDSLSVPDQPKVPPAPELTGKAVYGVVMLASVRGDPTRQQARLTAFLSSARDIAAGGVGRLEPETA